MQNAFVVIAFAVVVDEVGEPDGTLAAVGLMDASVAIFRVVDFAFCSVRKVAHHPS
jgi:hypothetical protein